MRRKGRHHLPRLPDELARMPLGDDKYRYLSFSPMGQFERMRAFLRGGTPTSKDGERRIRIMAWAPWVILAAMVLLLLVAVAVDALLKR